ncbi:unnamed protein product [Laminaria digitata]
MLLGVLMQVCSRRVPSVRRCFICLSTSSSCTPTQVTPNPYRFSVLMQVRNRRVHLSTDILYVCRRHFRARQPKSCRNPIGVLMQVLSKRDLSSVLSWQTTVPRATTTRLRLGAPFL